MRDFAEVRGDGSVDERVARRGLELFGVDELGLDKVDRAILDAVCARFGGGPVGLSTLAVSVGEETDTVEDVYEPYLLQLGLLMRTPRGRVATPAAWLHLGLELRRRRPARTPPPACSETAGAAMRRLPAGLQVRMLEALIRRRGQTTGVTVATSEQPRLPRRILVAMDVPEYDLPEAAIAQQPPSHATPPASSTPPTPAAGRSTAWSATCPLLVRPGDVLVVNTSRVMPARLRLVKADRGRGRGAAARARPRARGPGVWQALVRPGRRLAPGTVLAARRLGAGRRRGRRTPPRRPAPGPAPRRPRRGPGRLRHASPSRPTSTSRSPTPSATRPSTPTSRARWPPRPPGST